MADCKSQPSRTPLLEWVASSVGLALLAAVTGIIAYEAIGAGSPDVPAVTIEPRQPVHAGSGFIVPFEAHNAGHGTAAALQVEGSLLDGEQILETSTATIDYLPGRGTAEGGFFFTRDPRQHAFRARALGFQRP